MSSKHTSLSSSSAHQTDPLTSTARSTADVDALLPEAEQLAKSGQLPSALEKLAVLEKKSRQAADMVSTTRLLLASLALIRSTPSTSKTNWQLMNDTIISLSRKHGQLKQATTKMVQAAMCYLQPPGSAPVEVTEPPKEEEDTKMEEAAKTVEANAKDGVSAAEEPKSEREKDKERKRLEKEREGKEAEAVTKLLEQARRTGDEGLDPTARRKLVETLRQVTEGKVSSRERRR